MELQHSDAEAEIDVILGKIKELYPDAQADAVGLIFSRYGHRFSVQIDYKIAKGEIWIRTFHLEPSDIYNQFKKLPVATTEIEISIDEQGNLRCGLGAEPKFPIGHFLKERIPNYPGLISQYVLEYEKK